MVSQEQKLELRRYWINKSNGLPKLRKKLAIQALEIAELRERLEALEAKPKRSKKLPELEEDIVLHL